MRERIEVLDQRAAVLGREGLRMELHSPDRAATVLDPHHHALVGPRGHATLRADAAGDSERVVAHDREALGDACEQSAGDVAHGAEPAVHRPWRRADHPVEQASEPLMAQTDAQDWHLAPAQDIPTYAEVVPRIGGPRSRGDHDRIEVPA